MYSNYEKEKIGKTFKYYKIIKNIKWDEIKEKSKMSKTTFAKMSRGQIVKSDRCYDEFLRFFDLSYVQIENFERWLYEYLKRLDKALEYNNQEEIKQLHEEYINCLDNHKNEVIYEQYYDAFHYIFKYYIENQYLSEKDINKLLIFIESNLFEEIIQVYLLEIMYISNNNKIGSYSIKNELTKYIELYSHPILYQIKANHEKCERRFQSALDIHYKQLQYWENTQNQYRKIKTLNGMFMIYKNIDDNKAKEIIDMLENTKNTSNIPMSLIKSINYNIGIYYYIHNNYEKAYHWFMGNIEPDEVNKELIFIGAICTYLNIDLPEVFLDINCMNSNYKLYIDYFKNKKKGKTDKDLIEFINETLYYQKLMNVEYYEPLWRIFENEMDSFLKKSRKNYDSYIEFKEKMDKVCKYR